jgi:hypothetical protein
MRRLMRTAASYGSRAGSLRRPAGAGRPSGPARRAPGTPSVQDVRFRGGGPVFSPRPCGGEISVLWAEAAEAAAGDAYRSLR